MFWIRERAVEPHPPGTRGASEPETPRLRAWVERLAVPRHVFANARNNAWVCGELAQALESYGHRVHIQGRYRNVVALAPGARSRATTFIAAHYDTVPDCPGADDNGSGLAVLLECARVLADVARDQPIGFLAFNAEEDGLLGSRDFVSHVCQRSASRSATCTCWRWSAFAELQAAKRARCPGYPRA